MAAATIASEEGIRGHPSFGRARLPGAASRGFRPTGKIGQGWIRTSEGVKPADLQSAPFGHFGTYPFGAGDSYRLAPRSSQVVWVRTAARHSNDEIRMPNDELMSKIE